MAVVNNNKTGVLYPAGSSWVLDYYVDTLLSRGGSALDILRECSSSGCKSDTCSSKTTSWDRTSGFSSIDSLHEYQTLLIPTIYPFSVSNALLENLSKVQKRDTSIQVVVLDPLVIGELGELFALADVIQVFDQRDFNALLLEGISSELVDVQSYPLLENNQTAPRADNNKGLIIDVALGHEFRQVIVSSLYESLEPHFTLCRVPSLSRKMKDGDFDKTFKETISNRGLEARVQLESSTLEYPVFKNYFKDAGYCIVPGSSLDAMCERRALVALAVSYGLPVVIESQRSPLSEYQGQTYSVEGPSEKIKGISLSKAHVWAQKLLHGSGESIAPILLSVVSDEKVEPEANDAPLIVLSESIPRILFKPRENVFSHSGGDTVLLNRLVDGLRERGFDVEIDISGSEDVKKFDLVHLFNFALRDNTEGFAKECVQAGVPYVVTSLYEDWPIFFNQMMATYQCFAHYIREGQPGGVWEKLEGEINKIPSSEYWDNTYTATHAKAILTTGKVETSAVLRDYPQAKNVISIPLGCEVFDNFDGGQLFKEKYGLSDFVLSVGRLETRKNQLMLMKALENTEHTLVFITNNFTYQMEYAELCKSFQRKGKTVFLERLAPDELASAYQAAKVHALPSWYELPGLVSLEAGRYGTNVVACKNGTIEDYLGELGYYCNPNSYASILSAVNMAFDSPKCNALKERVSGFTWDCTVGDHEDLYREILEKKENVLNAELKQEPVSEVTPKIPEVVTSGGLLSMPSPSFEIERPTESQQDQNIDDVTVLLKAADGLMAKEQYQQALNCYIDIKRSNPDSSRVHRSLGVAYLQLKDLNQAKESFKRALSIDQMDIKALLGVGAVEWELGRKLEAYEIYKNAANLDSSNQSAVLYLVNSSYELNRLEELEGVLREYLKNDPQNTNIQYCLAGCFFKQDKYSLASATVERVLIIDENHTDALELKGIIERKTIAMASLDDENQAPIEPSDDELKPATGIESLKEKLEKMKLNRKFKDMISEVDSYSGPKGEDYNDLLILKSEALGCLGQKEEALAIFKELENQKYKLGKVYCGIGAIRASMSEWVEAEELFVKALEVDNTLDMPLCGLGMCAEANKNFEDAWNYFIESAKRNPENIQAITGVIRTGYTMDRLEDVEVVLKGYLELKPVDLYMLYALAGCLYAQGRTDEAVKELRNILIFEPQNDKANELLTEIESGTSYDKANLKNLSGASS